MGLLVKVVSGGVLGAVRRRRDCRMVGKVGGGGVGGVDKFGCLSVIEELNFHMRIYRGVLLRVSRVAILRADMGSMLGVPIASLYTSWFNSRGVGDTFVMILKSDGDGSLIYKELRELDITMYGTCTPVVVTLLLLPGWGRRLILRVGAFCWGGWVIAGLTGVELGARWDCQGSLSKRGVLVCGRGHAVGNDSYGRRLGGGGVGWEDCRLAGGWEVDVNRFIGNLWLRWWEAGIQIPWGRGARWLMGLCGGGSGMDTCGFIGRIDGGQSFGTGGFCRDRVFGLRAGCTHALLDLRSCVHGWRDTSSFATLILGALVVYYGGELTGSVLGMVLSFFYCLKAVNSLVAIVDSFLFRRKHSFSEGAVEWNESGSITGGMIIGLGGVDAGGWLVLGGELELFPTCSRSLKSLKFPQTKKFVSDGCNVTSSIINGSVDSSQQRHLEIDASMDISFLEHMEQIIVETDKVNHIVETDMMKLMVEIKCFGVNSDEFDKETRSSDEL
ncbi:hypothetical protein Tco_1265907 [Tanacetum coccineum]